MEMLSSLPNPIFKENIAHYTNFSLKVNHVGSSPISWETKSHFHPSLLAHLSTVCALLDFCDSMTDHRRPKEVTALSNKTTHNGSVKTVHNFPLAKSHQK